MEASSANKNFPKATRVSASEMHGHAPAAAKDTWIFNAEATSTLLIAAWYIFGVYITLGIIPNNAFFEWGAHWVIPFLLGVFYLGAGYLYQRHQCVTSLKSSAAYLKREVIVLDRLLSATRVRDVGALSHRQIGLHRLPQPLSTRFVRQITRVVAIGLWGYARHVNQEEYERSMPEPLMLPTQANDHPENGTFSPLLKRA